MSHVLVIKEKAVGGGKVQYFPYEASVFAKNKHLILGRRGEYNYREANRSEFEQYAKETNKEIKYKEKVEKPAKEEKPEQKAKAEADKAGANTNK